MSVYTKTGDGGDTSLLSGKRTRKCDPRIEMVGEIDEFTAHLGLCKLRCGDGEYKSLIENIQKELISISGYFVSLGDDPTGFAYHEDETKILEFERAIDEIEAMVPREKAFVLYGKCEASAAADIAKTVCRRCERRLYALDQVYPVSAFIKRYFNRLSDLLFCYARLCDFKHSEK